MIAAQALPAFRPGTLAMLTMIGPDGGVSTWSALRMAEDILLVCCEPLPASIPEEDRQSVRRWLRAEKRLWLIARADRAAWGMITWRFGDQDYTAGPAAETTGAAIFQGEGAALLLQVAHACSGIACGLWPAWKGVVKGLPEMDVAVIYPLQTAAGSVAMEH